MMNLIKKHENLTKEVLDKINQSKNRLQKNLKTFEIRLDTEDTEETEEQIASSKYCSVVLRCGAYLVKKEVINWKKIMLS